jgi:signal transduction histidine kinase|tara:strand:- start:412 stop:660 length:249 start_codon:yes stop_codon:yes gene_type:complete
MTTDTILIATPLIMLLGTLLINRENRIANAKLQRDLEAIRTEKEAERTTQAREDLRACLDRFDGAMMKLSIETGKIAHRVAK